MGYNKIEVELRRLLSQIETWRQKGSMPTIEQGIALGRLQQLYMMILDLPSSDFDDRGGSAPDDDGVASDESFATTSDGDDDEHAGHDDGDFADDLSAEPQSDVETVEKPETSEDIPEPETEPEQDSEQDSESTPTNSTEQDDEPHPDSSAPDSDPKPESTSEAEAETEAEAEPTVESAPESAQDVTPKVLIKPRIFGIEVNVYARHEIIDTLFRGDAHLFEAECETIDAMPSFEEALMYIGETYRWVPENAATIKFIDLVETRFSQS